MYRTSALRVQHVLAGGVDEEGQKGGLVEADAAVVEGGDVRVVGEVD